MHLHILTLHKLTPKGFPAIILHIKHNLVPPLIQLQWHRTLKWLDPGNGLIIAADKGTFCVLVIKHCHFEFEILI